MMFPHPTPRSLAHRARVLSFLGKQIPRQHPPTTPTQLVRSRELALYLIDMMALEGCDRWDAAIAWQTASEALPETPKRALRRIVDLIQWEMLAA
jgi:hypothetical protein